MPCGGAGDDLLGAAAAIHLGGVDQGHAEIDPEPHRRRLVGGAAPVLAHMPGPLAERRHPLAAAQCHRIAAASLISHLPLIAGLRRRKTSRAAP